MKAKDNLTSLLYKDVTNPKNIANTFNNFFTNWTRKLKFQQKKSVQLAVVLSKLRYVPKKTLIPINYSLSQCRMFIPFCFNLYISLLYHTLSKALDMSRKNIHLTSYSSMLLSKEVKISWVIDSSSFIEASPALKPGSFGEIRLLSKKYFNMLSNMIRSKIMLQIWRR